MFFVEVNFIFYLKPGENQLNLSFYKPNFLNKSDNKRFTVFTDVCVENFEMKVKYLAERHQII